MKALFRILVLLFFVAGGVCVYLAGSHHLVRTKDDFFFIEKEEFGFDDVVVDSRKWSPLDWLKQPHISAGVARKKWSHFKEDAKVSWQSFTSDLDKKFNELDLGSGSDAAQVKVAKLRKSCKKKYDALVAKLEKNEITFEQFQKKMKDLNAKMLREIDKIKKKFS